MFKNMIFGKIFSRGHFSKYSQPIFLIFFVSAYNHIIYLGMTNQTLELLMVTFWFKPSVAIQQKQPLPETEFLSCKQFNN